MKVVKWKLTAFYSAYMDQDLPGRPASGPNWTEENPRVLLGGRAQKFQLATQKSRPKTWKSMLCSVLQAKKGMPRPGKEELKASLTATFSKLTSKPPKQPWGIAFLDNGQKINRWEEAEGEEEMKPHGVLSREYIQNELRRDVREIFKDATYTDTDRYRMFIPASKAGFNAPQHKGGKLGKLVREENSNFRPVLNVVTLDQGKEEERIEEEARQAALEGEGNLIIKFLERFDDWKKKTQEETKENKVAMVALPEALKVRIITKHDPYITQVLQPLQKFMHTRMRQNKVFQLIGRPVEVKDLTCMRTLREGEKWLSGDYEAATDNLESWVSETIVEEVSTVLKLDELERRCARRSLTDHLIQNPDRNSQYESQKNGQLMGSILSFLILCLANYTACRMSMEFDEGKRIRMSRLRLRVNGDDCVFPITQSGRIFWANLTSYLGLRESVGKVYFSDKFLNINSTEFRMEEKSSLQQTPFVNMGLLLGLKRSGELDLLTEQDEYDMSARLSELVRMAPPNMDTTLYKCFFRVTKRN